MASKRTSASRAPRRTPKIHPLDRLSATWEPNYPGARKPLVLYTDDEISERFHVSDRAEAIATRNVARDVAEALARASGRLKDIGPIASRQIRTRFDGGMFQSALKGPFQIGLWFENAGPLVDEHYYPVMGKIYDLAEKNLTSLGGYKKASRVSLNAAVTVWYVEPEMWA